MSACRLTLFLYSASCCVNRMKASDWAGLAAFGLSSSSWEGEWGEEGQGWGGGAGAGTWQGPALCALAWVRGGGGDREGEEGEAGASRVHGATERRFRALATQLASSGRWGHAGCMCGCPGATC